MAFFSPCGKGVPTDIAVTDDTRHDFGKRLSMAA
jgi:hypothetical protein